MTRRVVIRRVVYGVVGGVLVLALACAGLMSAWLAGVKVPGASGSTYLQISKLGGADRISRAPDGVFFIALVGSDLRPGVGGARGDALHLVGVNTNTHTATMLNVPRDTCFNGDKINVAHSRGGPRGMANALGALAGTQVAYAVSVDFAGFTSMVDGVGGLQMNVPGPMHDSYSGANFAPGWQHLNGDQALQFSRDRHDYPNSDITRTGNQGLLILAGMQQLQAQTKSVAGQFKVAALVARHARLDGMGLADLYRLGRIASQVNTATIRSVTIPVGGGSCLSLGGGAQGLFADFADDATLQSH
jgi:polyisoprenyl-teichoic acid--peptidoglycan teichoic acid transferase